MTAVFESSPDFSALIAFERPTPTRWPAAAKPKADDDLFDAAACIGQVRDGDEEAARALMDRLYPLIAKLVRAYLPRRTSEEDLIQIVFMKIFARLDQYSGLVPIEHWVSRIAVNTCLNQLKSEKIRPEWRFSDLTEKQQLFVESLASTEDPPAESGTLAAEVVSRLLRLLKPADRLVVQLLHMEEKSILEIAQITGWSVAVIKVRAFRARKKLQKHLRDLEPAMSAGFTA